MDPNRKRVLLLTILYGAAVAAGLFQVLRKGGPGPRPVFGKLKDGQGVVAVVPIHGIVSVADQGQMFGASSSDRLNRRLKSLEEQEDVKAVVLRINTPGGSVGAVQEVYDSVLHLKKAGKKVVVSMGDVAASGGYYVAAAADEIFAAPGTLTGSIGVILQVGNMQELSKKIGVKMESIKSAEHKDIASPFKAMSEKERQILQSIINDAYGQFVDAIVSGRKMDKEKVLRLADGRIYSGAQAKAEGLVDQMGNLDAAIARAAELAGIKEKPRVLYNEDSFGRLFSMFSRGPDFWDRAFSRFGVRFAYVWEYSI